MTLELVVEAVSASKSMVTALSSIVGIMKKKTKTSFPRQPDWVVVIFLFLKSTFPGYLSPFAK